MPKNTAKLPNQVEIQVHALHDLALDRSYSTSSRPDLALRSLDASLSSSFGARLRRLGFVVVLALIGAVSGCAYRAGYADRAMPGGYTLVSVPVFRNNTMETGTEVVFTNALIRELERSKVARVTTGGDSQATLEGTVDRITYLSGPQVIQRQNQALELPRNTVLTTSYRVQVVTRLTLRRNSDSSIIWHKSFELERNYNAPTITRPDLNSANALYNQNSRVQTIAAIAQDMMAEAHDRLMENFW